MGGTRCTFRSCTSSNSTFPNMHFFHYPVRKPTFSDWIKYAQSDYILSLPESKQRNKCVCMLHFRDECFMNYRKNRLIAQAVPTLDRLLNGMVIDYERSDELRPIALSPTKLPHLIPPEGYVNPCDAYYPRITGKNVLQCSMGQKKRNHADKTYSAPQPSKKPRMPIETKKILNKINMTESRIASKSFTTVTMLNCASDTRSYSENISLDFVNDVIEFVDADEEADEPNTAKGQKLKVTENDQLIAIDETSSDFESISCSYAIPAPLSSSSRTSESQSSTEIITKPVASEILSQKTTLDRENIQEKQRAEYSASISEAEMLIAKLEEELAKAKKEAELANIRTVKAVAAAKELEAKQSASSQQVATVSTSKDNSTIIPAPPLATQLTKSQLFNGIRKYLSSSMTALVRMEMFGSAERKWKPDEKQVSVEIMRLGENVFKYFSDEWRFRLPPVKLVGEWLNESLDVADDEEDL